MRYRASTIKNRKAVISMARRTEAQLGINKMRKMKRDIVETVGMMWQLDRAVVISGIFHALIEAVIPFVGIYLSAYVLDGLGAGMDSTFLLPRVAAAVLLVFVLTVLKSYCKKIYIVHAYICFQKFEMEIGKKTLEMDYELLESPLVNDIRTRIRNDRNWGSGFYSVIQGFSLLMSSLFGLGIAIGTIAPLFVDGDGLFAPSALLLLFGFACLVFLSTWFMAKKRKRLHHLMDEASKVRSHADYFFSRRVDYKSGKDIRTYRGQRIIETYVTKIDEQMSKWMRSGVSSESQSGFVNGISMGALEMFAYLFVVCRAAMGALTVGLVLKYAASIYRFAMLFSQVCSAFSEFMLAVRRQQSTMEYRRIEGVLYKGSLPVEKRFFCEEQDNDYEIEFCNVSFRYPGTEQYALKNLSFRFRTGERLAVVGRNGSGKTTFIKLLCRLYDPTEGEILLNGIDIRKYDYEEYQTIFSVVFQDFRIFSFSIAENVAVSVRYEDDKVKSCLMKAGFGERLASLPEGTGTFLYKNFDKNGVEISGGEAQKIALARALYKDAPFMILDEPTAALDPIAEYEVYSRFNEIIGKKTAVYISHRLSSCRFCDDIAVFDKGCLIQRGSHEKLVEDKEGEYYKLWHAQAQYYN